mgnify:FL=1
MQSTHQLILHTQQRKSTQLHSCKFPTITTRWRIHLLKNIQIINTISSMMRILQEGSIWNKNLIYTMIMNRMRRRIFVLLYVSIKKSINSWVKFSSVINCRISNMGNIRSISSPKIRIKRIRFRINRNCISLQTSQFPKQKTMGRKFLLAYPLFNLNVRLKIMSIRVDIIIMRPAKTKILILMSWNITKNYVLR